MLYGVIVSVHADAGVFPAGAALSVTRVLLLEQKQAEAAVEDVRDENENVAASYTFDIKVIDPITGAEYQPADGQVVSVSFSLAEVADENLTTSVYHIAEDAQGMTAEPLEVTTEDEVTATVETDGFSIYTVEFTYGSMQYVLDVDGSGTVTIRGGHGANANNGIDGANADIAVMGNVTVNGTDLNANYSNGDDLQPKVTITGGTVNATSMGGSGLYSNGDITVTGGKVTAQGGIDMFGNVWGGITLFITSATIYHRDLLA